MPASVDHTVLKRWSAEYPREKLLVWVSGGKDAFCCLKLAVDAIGEARIVPVFRYFVEGLRCAETPVRAQLSLLGIKHPLVTVPSVDTLDMMSSGTYTTMVTKAGGRRRQIKFVDVEELARKRTGVRWTASGEKLVDTIMRRLWLRTAAADGIDRKSHRVYPVINWSHHQVRSLCQLHGAPLAPTFGGEISSGLGIPELPEIKRRYPDDYARIIKAFPFIEATVVRDSLYGKRPRTAAQKRAQERARAERKNQVPDGNGRDAQPQANPARRVQSPTGQ